MMDYKGNHSSTSWKSHNLDPGDPMMKKIMTNKEDGTLLT